MRRGASFRWVGGESRCKPYAIRLYHGTLDVPYVTDPHDYINVLNGFTKRVACQTVREEFLNIGARTGNFDLINSMNRELSLLGNFVKNFIEQNLTPLDRIDSDFEFENWLNSCDHYNEVRKNQLRKAYSQYKLYGITEKDYVCKSFIKREFYEEMKLPRLINSRSDKFKAIVGPVMKKIEHQVYKLKWFVKGRIVTDLARPISILRKYRYILETDYSSFESSFQSFYTQKVEEQLWRYMLVNNPDILRIIDLSYNVNGHPRVQKLVGGEYIATTTGSRMSGEMWTSLANGFSNLMNMLYLIDKYHIDGDGFVEGDDGLFGLSSDIISEHDFNLLGFRIKMNYGHDLSHTSFCGNVFDSSDFKVIVSPENIARLQWSCAARYLKSNSKTMLGLLRAKSMSLYCIGRYTPIAGLLAWKILKLIGVDGKVIIDPSRKFWRHEVMKIFHSLKFERPVVSENARDLYYNKFNISRSCQIECEDIIERARSLDDLLLPYVFVTNELDYLVY